MPRTPFNARILSPLVAGGPTTFTVPAGKIAICNSHGIVPSMSSGPIYLMSRVNLNGVNVTTFSFSTQGRYGPFVFNAGDVISCPGVDSTFPNPSAFGLSGFLYDQSTRKVPIGQLMTRTSTYTVPSGKYVVVNFFAGSGIAAIHIDGVAYGSTTGSASMGGMGALGVSMGPYTANATQTLGVREVPITAPGQPGSGMFPISNFDGADRVFMNGFLYNI